jgi:drug/metabolite transporter (DMT)-like permease
MPFLQYGALLIAQIGIMGKQFSMKKCGAIAPGPFRSVCINAMRALICLAVSAVLWLVMDGKGSTVAGNWLSIASGLGTALSLFCWILASRLVSMTLIECVNTLGTTVVPLILAPFLYNGETPSPLQWVGCALVCVSLFFFMNPAPKKERGTRTASTLIASLLTVGGTAVGVTLSMVLKKYYTFHVTDAGLGSAEYFTLMQFVGAIAFFAILIVPLYFREKSLLTPTEECPSPRVTFPFGRVWPFVLVAAASLYVNELFTVYAAGLPSAIFYPLSKGLTILFTFLLDTVAFRDKVTVKKIIGLVTVLAAIVLVNL